VLDFLPYQAQPTVGPPGPLAHRTLSRATKIFKTMFYKVLANIFFHNVTIFLNTIVKLFNNLSFLSLSFFILNNL
jgi:hypothetical protein